VSAPPLVVTATAPAATTPHVPADAPAAPVAPATAPAAALATATAPAPVAPQAAPAAAAPTLAGASLQATVDRVHELVRISTTRGGARATLQLRPVELGTVDVRLRTSHEGLVATITAQDDAGLAALQQAGAELRRNLEDRGVTLHRLDLQLANGGGAGGTESSASEAGAGGRQASARHSSLPGLPGTDEEPADDELAAVSAVVTSRPGLVDVKA
jgi:flagellar hook-length control protein FliK